MLTVAAASGQPLRGGALLAVYAAGMTVPLFALAAAWDRLRIGQRRWLRGTGVRVGPVRLHTHSVIAGLIFIGLGVVFLRYQGTAGLTGLLAPPSLTGWDNRLQDAVTAIQAHVPDLALLAAAAAMVIAVAAWRLRRARRPVLADPPRPPDSRPLSRPAPASPQSANHQSANPPTKLITARRRPMVSQIEQGLLDGLGERWVNVQDAGGDLVHRVGQAHGLDQRLDDG